MHSYFVEFVSSMAYVINSFAYVVMCLNGALVFKALILFIRGASDLVRHLDVCDIWAMASFRLLPGIGV